MGKKPPLLRPPKKGIGIERKNSKKVYQTKDWKQFREEMKRIKRKEHEAIVMDVYKSNPGNKSEDLMEFLKSDYPLSEPMLKKGIIKVANVLDHKHRIRSGGAILSRKNVQWMTTEEHNSKSGKEAHE